MNEWTDIDYAQAAIDMLPESVEGIAEFLQAQGIRGIPNSSTRCPISLWVEKWMGRTASTGADQTGPITSGNPRIDLPTHVREFILAVDRKQIKL